MGSRALTRNAGDGLIETVGAAVEALGPTAECASESALWSRVSTVCCVPVLTTAKGRRDGADQG